MKTFKKITSMITALTMLSAMTVLPTSAVQTTEYTVSYDTLTQAIQTEDGSTVPAGSVAVTVSVSGNIGFDANTFNLDIGEDNSILTNLAGYPIITKEHEFEDALIAADSNGSDVCVAVAMSSSFYSNGALFTFFLENDATENVEIISTDEQFNMTGMTSGMGGSNQVNTFIGKHNGHRYECYYSGDADDDNFVNSCDATEIRVRLAAAGETEILVNSTNYQNYFNTYFPDIVYADQPDANLDGFINDDDAVEILQYAAAVGVGAPYNGNVHTLRYGQLIG